MRRNVACMGFPGRRNCILTFLLYIFREKLFPRPQNNPDSNRTPLQETMTREDLTAFVPMTREEMRARGWDAIDILIVTGDAYVDHQIGRAHV